MNTTSTTRQGRRGLRVGELPRIYIGMRRYDPKTAKMVHCKGLTITVRNYTPEDARRVIREAFARDTEEKFEKIRRQIGGLHD